MLVGTFAFLVSKKETVSPFIYNLRDNAVQIKHPQPRLDLVAPILTLKGDTDIYIPVGTEYMEPGYSARDNIEGDITYKVHTSGPVDTSKKGVTHLTYTTTDAAGNSHSLNRNIYVFDKQTEAALENPGDKVVYLTFDDGPSKHTLTLLDILDCFGVKATFFVTNQYPYNNDTIGLTHEKGHTIALHTYSHDYKKIYQSEKAYFEDLEKISRICEKQTGEKPVIIRFPGGTSNGISKKYKKGIMTKLSTSVIEKGYQYCDWNVDSGDAAGAKTSEEVAKNVITGIQKHDTSIVLQHDTSSYSVEAVKQIIYWGLDNGYTFLPMSEDTEMIHFPPKN